MAELKAEPGGFTSYVEEEICKRLSRFAVAGKLPHANKWGVDVLYNKKASNLGLIRFRFVNNEDMLIEYDFDMRELKKQGRRYLEDGIKKLEWAQEDFRKARQNETPEIIMPVKSKAAAAIGEAMRAVH